MKRTVLPIILMLLAGGSALTQALTPLPPLALPDADAGGVGGVHAAVPSGFQSLLINPAGFALSGRELGAAQVVANLSGPILDVFTMLPGLLDGSLSVATLIPALVDDSNRLYAALDLTGPLAFGYVGGGLGFGFFDHLLVEVNVASLFYASITVRAELLFAGGYAWSVPLPGNQTLELGIMPKGFLRAEVQATGDILSVANLFSDPAGMLSSQPLELTSGAGFDAGLTWRYVDRLALALVCHDVFTPALVTAYTSLDAFLADAAAAQASQTGGLISPDLAFSAYFNVPMELLTRLGLRMEVMADYKNILNLFEPLSRHPLLGLGLGLRFTMLDIVQLSAGINEALPAFGLSLDLTAFRLSASMYGRELGLEPGQRPVFNLMIGLIFVY